MFTAVCKPIARDRSDRSEIRYHCEITSLISELHNGAGLVGDTLNGAYVNIRFVNEPVTNALASEFDSGSFPKNVDSSASQFVSPGPGKLWVNCWIDQNFADLEKEDVELAFRSDEIFISITWTQYGEEAKSLVQNVMSDGLAGEQRVWALRMPELSLVKPVP